MKVVYQCDMTIWQAR